MAYRTKDFLFGSTTALNSTYFITIRYDTIEEFNVDSKAEY